MLLTRFLESNAWDEAENLPLCPGLNNPWLYMAYADMLMRWADDGSGIAPLEAEVYFLVCEAAPTVKDPAPGRFARWPTGSDQTSHDEIMGAAYLSPWIARRILAYLDMSDGEFNITGEPETTPMQFNVYRMLFLRPYLMGAAGYTPNLASQLLWSACILFSAITRPKQDAGGTLRDGLMTMRMGRFRICAVAILLWRLIVNRRGLTPKYCLTIEPREKPIYGESAPERW